MDIDFTEIYEKILEENSSVIYLSDIETDQLIYLNRGTLKMLGRPVNDLSYIGEKCYRILQGRDTPCDFCNNKSLSCAQFLYWDYYNPMLKCYFSIRDKKIMLSGRAVRLEIADDITELMLEKQQLQEDLSAEKSLFLCIQNLTAAESDDQSIHDLLEKICDLYEGERGYIFEFDYDAKICSNRYEWCKIGVEPEINSLQHVPLEDAQLWIDKFSYTGEFCITQLDQEFQADSIEYSLLAPQGITGLVSVPLLKNNQIIGFLGVDNPQKKPEDLSLMKTVAQFVANDMEKRKILKALEKSSNMDLLAKVYNRNRYITDVQKLRQEESLPIGVIFLDLDNLKFINDNYGHNHGDKLIVKAASILDSFFPGEVYRIGGDEFIVLSKGLSNESFDIKLNVLREKFRSSDIQISIGTKWLPGGKDLNKAILAADEIMYQEKANSKKNPKHHLLS